MRALVLSGGGANGAYECGALIHILGTVGVKYDLVVGTSVGALNAGAICQFAHGHEAEAAEFLEDEIWDAIDGNGDIYRKHYHGWLWHIPVLWKNSVYCTKPLRQKVQNQFDPAKVRTANRKLRVGGVSWDTGESTVWTEQDDDLRQGILASSSFPMFFEDAKARGQTWTDWGVREVTPLGTAIKEGATEIDVIVCSPDLQVHRSKKGSPGKGEKIKLLLDILLDEINDGDLAATQYINALCEAGHPLAKGKREVSLRVLRHQEPLGDSLNFDREKNQRVKLLGLGDAQKVDWLAEA